MAEAEAGGEIHADPRDENNKPADNDDDNQRSQLMPPEMCQTILKDEQGFSQNKDRSDQDDYTTEDEETEEESEDFSDEEEDTQNTDNIRKIRKLANLFAMVKSMKEDANVHTKSKSVSKRRGNSEPVVCDYCPESFVCFASLNTHSKKEHGVNLLQCTECGKECNSLNLLKVHIKMKHEKRRNEPVVTGRFPCESCNIKYQTESALILHKYKKHGVKLAIICPFCDRVFNRVSNAENLYNHTVKEHKDKKNCPEYTKIVNDFLKFRENSDTFCCKSCNKTFESSYKLKSHQYKVHNEREASFLCDKCDKVFKFRGELNFHYQKYHSGVTFVCPDCGKSFNHKYNLEIHIKMVHVKNKTLSCDVCGKMFFIPSKLEHHRRTVHEKLKPFQCEFCGFRCAAHGNLNLHRKTQHNAEKLTIAEYNNKHGIVKGKKPGGKSNTQNAISKGIAAQKSKPPSESLEPIKVDIQENASKTISKSISSHQYSEERKMTIQDDSKSGSVMPSSNTPTQYQYLGPAPLHLQYHPPPAPVSTNTTLPPGHQYVSYPPQSMTRPAAQPQEYYLIPNPMTSIAPWTTLVTTQPSHGPV